MNAYYLYGLALYIFVVIYEIQLIHIMTNKSMWFYCGAKRSIHVYG